MSLVTLKKKHEINFYRTNNCFRINCWLKHSYWQINYDDFWGCCGVFLLFTQNQVASTQKGNIISCVINSFEVDLHRIKDQLRLEGATGDPNPNSALIQSRFLGAGCWVLCPVFSLELGTPHQLSHKNENHLTHEFFKSWGEFFQGQNFT